MPTARLSRLPVSVVFLSLVLVQAPWTAAPGAQAAATRTAGTTAVDARFEGFDRFVADVMRDWKIPGLAVAAIEDGKVVLAQGYGYRDVEKRLPVTPATLMAIGSNSKSFTVTLMGILADEKQLDWDKPVRTYLPDFELKDDVATRLMTPTDLVTHRSGLPRHDLMWYGRAFSRKEMYARLRFLEPSATFRQRYQYNNLMFMTAGYLIEQVTGQSWDEAVRARIFAPLGMARSNTSVRDLPASGDYALPYMERDGKVVPVPFRILDAIAPAGAINSSVEEMTRYIRMHIDGGSYDGKPIVSKVFATRMQSPHSAAPPALDQDAPRYPEIGPGAYGLGVDVASYRGHKIVSHGGGIDGFISSMSWMPDDRLGVMVLTNFSGVNPVPGIVMRQVYDRLLRLEPVDWVGRTKAQQARAEKRQKEREQKEEAEKVAGTSPSHPLAAYAGAYDHPGYGLVRVTESDGRLTLAIDSLVSELEHVHYDVFRGARSQGSAPSEFRNTRIRFTHGPDGKIDGVAIPLEPAAPEIVFKRKAEER
jgi:CubicO group peptidase (beta-lactamase class C family)